MTNMLNKIVLICVIISSIFFVSPLVAQQDESDDTLSRIVPVLRTIEDYNGTTPLQNPISYSWYSWSETLDIDNNGVNDTVEINYNLTNFNIAGYINVGFEFIIIGENESIYDRDNLFGYILSEDDVLSFNWIWSARQVEPQNYTILVNQFIWENSQYYTYGNETFYFEDLARMDLIDSYSIGAELFDRDQDGENDTVNINLELNFTTEVELLDLLVVTEVEIWNEAINEWESLTSLYEEQIVQNSNSCIVHVGYSAVYDGYYNITLHLSNQYLEDFASFDLNVSMSRFALVSYKEGSLNALDADGDTNVDSFKVNYEFNFTVDDFVDLWIELKITQGNNLIFDKYTGFTENVQRGLMYGCEFLWHSTVTGNLKVEITFSHSGQTIIYDVYTVELWTYDVIEDAKVFLEAMDTSGNGNIDSVKIHNAIKFKKAQHFGLELSVSVFEETPQGSNFVDNLYQIFDGNVSEDQYYDVWSIYYAPKIAKYKFVIDVRDVNDGFYYVEGFALFFQPEEKYQPVSSWNYDINYIDRDSDGFNDTVDVSLHFQVTYSGEFHFIITGSLSNEYMTYFFSNEFDQENLTTGVWYTITLRLTAFEEGDYAIEIQLKNGQFICLSFETTWENAKLFNAFNDYKYTFTELDSDNDGLNDTLFIKFDFKPSYSGKLTVALLTIVYYREVETGNWKLLTAPNAGNLPFYSGIAIFDQEVSRDEWYSLNTTFALPFDGEFNITVSAQPLFTFHPIIGSYLFQDGYQFNGTKIDITSYFNKDGLSFVSNFNGSGQIDLDIEILVFSGGSSGYGDVNIDIKRYSISWDIDSNDTLEWYTQLNITSSQSLVIFTIRYNGVIIFTSLHALDIQSFGREIYPLEPIDISEFETTAATTSTTIDVQSTTSIHPTPAWSFIMVVLSGVVLLLRRRKSYT